MTRRRLTGLATAVDLQLAACRTAGHALGGGTSLIERLGRAVVPTPTCADVPPPLETRLAASLGKSQ